MKLTNLSSSGILFGLFLTGGTWIRYFIMAPDLDKALYFGLVGLLIIAVSWNYNKRIQQNVENKERDIKLQCLEEYISDQNYQRIKK